MENTPVPLAFIEACFWHGSIDAAEAIRAAHPEIAAERIHVAAMLGDEAVVRRCLEVEPASATDQTGPHRLDPLTCLCFSAYLRDDRSRTDGFVRAATALLDGGASATTGFWDRTHLPEPEWESVIYGAAGVAHHPEMTRLLLERGADPNDEETPYHSPETRDNAALTVLVDSGRLTADSLATMLLRKADWHDHDGIKLLLERGADPNRMTRWCQTALHQAVRRDNDLDIIALMLGHGADPTLPNADDQATALAISARRGRKDILDTAARRGVQNVLRGLDQLLAACATHDTAAVRAIAERDPELVSRLTTTPRGGTALAQFAGTANTDGVRHLLDLGVPVDARYEEGDGYFGIARGSTALHVAAWRAWHDTVRFLVGRGASIDARDGKGRTALALAVRACVDSHWSDRRSPASVKVLLDAGASKDGVVFPTGYDEVDALLR